MKNLQIIREASAEAATAAAGEALNNLLAANKAAPLLLLLSAGSALGLLDYISAQNTGEHLTVAALDERFSADENVNNFARLQKTDFYALALETQTNFFGSLPRIIPQGVIRGLPRSGETMGDLAQRMEKNLRDWKNENPQGKIIATLGMGHDGHVAGIMPFADDPKKFNELFYGDAWIAAYSAANKNPFPERITATISFIKTIDFGIGFVCGQNKKAKLDQLALRAGAIAELPALVFWEIKNLTIYTDLK